MTGRRMQGIVGALAVIGVAVSAAAQGPVVAGACKVEVPAGWTNGVRLREVEGPGAVVEMSAGFQRIEDTSAFIVFSRALPKGATQLRSVTRTRPACTASLVARASDSAAVARTIARSISRSAPD